MCVHTVTVDGRVRSRAIGWDVVRLTQPLQSSSCEQPDTCIPFISIHFFMQPVSQFCIQQANKGLQVLPRCFWNNADVSDY